MADSTVYNLAADAVLLIHIAFVAFVVLGLLLIYLGCALDWRWVRRRVWRIAHLVAIAVVVVQSWLGLVCPLTTWEMQLRAMAGSEVYAGSFIQHWLHALLYYRAPDWVFLLVYTIFGSLVLASWFIVRPTPFRR